MLTIPERPAAGRHALSFAKKPHVTGITDRILPQRQRSIVRAAASPIRPTGNVSASIPWRWTGPNRALERPGLRSHGGGWERSKRLRVGTIPPGFACVARTAHRSLLSLGRWSAHGVKGTAAQGLRRAAWRSVHLSPPPVPPPHALRPARPSPHPARRRT